ncbi:hypothetical protein BpHYR1_026760 [Brachionus plicatilis]|uniref:Uncharacterized protein n=1 Tax=Brachionus plicatilis TaxID=10195 RepID=A0A3M7R1J9_BRAPC|nr:hypothetical protein BpHYR1_026760 [Brachionus plicatilis]
MLTISNMILNPSQILFQMKKNFQFCIRIKKVMEGQPQKCIFSPIIHLHVKRTINCTPFAYSATSNGKPALTSSELTPINQLDDNTPQSKPT